MLYTVGGGKVAIDRGEAEEDEGPESSGEGCGIARDLSP